MARSVVKAVCPSCFKERELAEFKFGVIHVTMCPYCLSSYLVRCIIPAIQKSNVLSPGEIDIASEAISLLDSKVSDDNE